MDYYVEPSNPRLGVNDKRHLYQSLLSLAERLLFLNKFPVDMEDFALSMQPAEVEEAWRLLNTKDNYRSLSPANVQYFICNDIKWMLHVYSEGPNGAVNLHGNNIFMDVTAPIEIACARRHLNVVSDWCSKQQRLEEQVLRSAKVIKAVVHSCNTVGQYKRVSPDLLTFLPEKYKDALRDYTKQSPYPAITVEPEEIDTTLSTLAFASLQPVHHSEKEYQDRPKWAHNSYNLDRFPRSKGYQNKDVRRLEL